MPHTPFIWLGSGRARRRGVARKGQLLDQAARLGLPVPSGGILLDKFYQICLKEGVIEKVGERIIVPDPEWLQEVIFRDLRFPHLAKDVAIRPAASGGHAQERNVQRAQLGIDLDNFQQLADALRAVWSLEHEEGEREAHDVLVMEMVDAEVAGQATTDKEEEFDLVAVTAGPGARLDTPFALQQIGTFQRTSPDAQPFARRLQKLLRGVRRSFGKGAWRIDWADDGAICHLVQIGPDAVGSILVEGDATRA